MTTRRNFISLALTAAFPAAASRAAPGAPDIRSLQLVVPTPPGTQPDLIARWLIDPLSKSAGVPGAVLNRPGAAGAIAADTVLTAPTSAGPLLLSGLDAVAYSHINTNRRRLDPFIDFVPVGAVNRDTWLVVVPFGSPLKTIKDLEHASQTTSLNYATSGEGSTPHLITARFVRDLGIKAVHVPYKQSYLPDLIAGRVDFVVAPTPAMLSALRSGQLRALTSLTDKRLAVIGDVPSIRELGWPNQVFYAGLFLFAPAALAARAAELNQWLLTAIRQPTVKVNYREAGIEPVEYDVDQVRAEVADRIRTVDSMRETVFGQKQSHWGRHPISAPVFGS